MTGDFSRLTFEPAKQFSRVLMQQGRVQLDADWNEQASLLLYQVRTLARAVIGRYGGIDDAFHITGSATGTPLLAIGAGAYFVNGILCSSDGVVPFVPPGDWKTNDGGIRPLAGDYLVYLAVAERHITFVNDDDIREKALGEGIDTTSRTKVVAAVSAVKIDGLLGMKVDARNKAVEDALDKLRPELGRPMMRASVETQSKPHDICNVPPFAQFRGSGNQLYRVEIHAPAAAGKGATFKWSRENGSVVFPVTAGVKGTKIGTPRYDRDRFQLEKGDWVEFEDDDLIASSNPPFDLSRVESVDSDSITVDKVPVADFGAHPEKHPLLRRWDHAAQPGGATYYHRGTIEIQDEKRSFPLELGLQVEFHAEGNKYTRGDYWVIPARTLTGGIDWPVDQYLPARRAETGYAPLAAMTIGADGKLAGLPTDLRSLITPAAAQVP
jgi:hypothetical protein